MYIWAKKNNFPLCDWSALNLNAVLIRQGVRCYRVIDVLRNCQEALNWSRLIRSVHCSYIIVTNMDFFYNYIFSTKIDNYVWNL